MVPTRRRFLSTVLASLAATTAAGCLGGESGPGANDSTATSPVESASNDTSTATEAATTEPSGNSTDATATPNGTGEGNYNHQVIISNQYDAERTVEVRVADPETGDTDEASTYYADSYTVGAKDQKSVFDFSTLEAETGGEREFAVSVTHDGETTSGTVQTAACYRGITFALDPEDGVRVFASAC